MDRSLSLFLSLLKIIFLAASESAPSACFMRRRCWAVDSRERRSLLAILDNYLVCLLSHFRSKRVRPSGRNPGPEHYRPVRSKGGTVLLRFHHIPSS